MTWYSQPPMQLLPQRFVRRLGLGLALFSLWAALSAPSAGATQVSGHLDLTTSSCGCTINSVRVGIVSIVGVFTNTDPFWVEARIIVVNGNDSAQTGQTLVSHTSIVDNCTTTTSQPDFWRWTTSSVDMCDYTSTVGSNYYVERLSTSSTKWVLLIDGSTVQTSGALFSSANHVYAGGKASRDDLAAPTVCKNYGASSVHDWERSAQANNQTKTWTTVTTGDGVSRLQQGKWIVGLLPDPFYVEYNPNGLC